MPLPKIVTPQFSLTMPSTGEEVLFRPFLMKEEKVLYMALESKDEKEIRRAILSIIDACVLTEGLDIHALPSYDVEYIFIKIRSKSVGEIANVTMRGTPGDGCMKEVTHENGITICSATTEVDINLDEVEVDVHPERKNVVMITDTIGVKLREPSLNMLESMEKGKGDSINRILGIMYKCVEVIFDGDEVYADFNEKELQQFFDNLTQDNMKQIQKYFSTIPKLRHTINWTCTECGKSLSHELEGLSNFFTFA